MYEFFEAGNMAIRPEHARWINTIWEVAKCTIILVVSVKIYRWFANRIFTQLTSKIHSSDRASQFLTLKTILSHAIETVFFVVYIGNLLNLFGVDVRPLLATAGVLGVAIGFGAKRFVEDVITGIIILLEGQIRVGDYVEIQGMEGTVEKITLPLITLRSAANGSVYYIRCGYINSINNQTMNYSYACFEFDVAYKENIDHVAAVIKRAFEKLKQYSNLAHILLGEIEIFGLDEFRASSVCVKCRIKTQPKGQWIIKRAFNKIVKEEFDKENIEIPFNQLVVTNTNA